MGVFGIPAKHFAALIFTILACIIDLIGFAAPYWYYQKISSTSKAYSGIWRYCSMTGSTTVCFNYIDQSNLQAWVEAVQAMETIGLILLFASLVILCIRLFCLKTKLFLKYIIISILIAAAVFILIGVIIYGTEASSAITEHLHFAFAFVIIAAGFAIIASIFMCV